jgi:hypothetical protein
MGTLLFGLPPPTRDARVCDYYHASSCRDLVGALRFEQRRSETIDLQSTPDTVTGLSTHDISFADALFAMLNGINCSSYRLST